MEATLSFPFRQSDKPELSLTQGLFPLTQFEDIIPSGHLFYWLLKHDGYHWNEMTFQSLLLDPRMCQ